MKTDHLPRHIEEHVRHCPVCQKAESLCPVGSKLFADSEIIRKRIEALPKLSSYSKNDSGHN